MAGPLPDGPIDTLGVYGAILSLPARLSEASDSAPVADLPPITDVDHVVVVSPGSATTAGDIVAVLAAPVANVPVLVSPPATLPAFVTARSLVMVLATDDDRDAVAAARAATERGAPVVAVAPEMSALGDVVISGGGSLAAVTSVTPDPALARFDVAVLAVGALAVLEQLGQLAEIPAATSAAVSQLERRRQELTATADPAGRLARRIGRTLPLVLGSDRLAGVAATHWKRQVNRNAKAASFASSLPVAAADELAGWGQHGDMTRQVFSLVTLRHDLEPAGTVERFAAAEALLDEVVHERHEVRAEGDGPLAQLLDLIFYGDLLSWHLATQLEIDPGPVDALDEIRSVWSNP